MEETLKLRILKGSPLLLQKSNLFFFHRTINEIIDFGYLDFLKIVQLFRTTKEEIEEIMPVPGMTPFMYFLLILQQDSELSVLFRRGLEFFVGAINIIGKTNDQVISCSFGDITNIEITEEGYQEIVEYISLVYNGIGSQPEDDSNLSEAEKKMKKKFEDLKKLREKTKRKEDTEGKSEFSDMIGGFLSRNMNMSFREVLELPYYTFFFLLKKLKNYDDYDLQLRAMLAGADIDKELHHWLQGSDEDNEY